MEPTGNNHRSKPLNPLEKEIYGWQMTVDGFGEAGQERLKGASVLVSRCGGLGGVVAYELAAAGIGRLILAHGGQVKPSDLNRQLLMTRDWIGKSRMDSIQRRLHDLNPDMEIVAVDSNIHPENVEGLVRQSDLIVDCAPLFEERYLLNEQAVRQGKPMVECAVFEMEAHLTTMIPGQTPCLKCLYPEKSSTWTRRFPVFGAVSGTVGCLAALEVIKYFGNFGSLMTNRLMNLDFGTMEIRTFRVRKDPACALCSGNESKPLNH